jgi:prophage regulatory protein
VNEQQHLPAPRRVLRLRATLQRVGKCKSAWYADIAAGKAPKPVKIGARAVAWPEEDVDAWLSARVAERDGAHPINEPVLEAA